MIKVKTKVFTSWINKENIVQFCYFADGKKTIVFDNSGQRYELEDVITITETDEPINIDNV